MTKSRFGLTLRWGTRYDADLRTVGIIGIERGKRFEDGIAWKFKISQGVSLDSDSFHESLEFIEANIGDWVNRIRIEDPGAVGELIITVKANDGEMPAFTLSSRWLTSLGQSNISVFIDILP